MTLMGIESIFAKYCYWSTDKYKIQIKNLRVHEDTKKTIFKYTDVYLCLVDIYLTVLILCLYQSFSRTNKFLISGDYCVG